MISTIWPSGMRIEKFRSFENVKFKLGRQITLISGQNGSGKSNLLSLIASASGLSKKSTLGSNFQPDFNEFFAISSTENYRDYNLYVDFSNDSGEHVISKKLTFKDDTELNRGIRVIPRLAKLSSEDKRTLTTIGKEAKETYGVGGAARVPIPTIYLSLSRLYPIGEKKDNVNIQKVSLQNSLYRNDANGKFAEWYNQVIAGSIRENAELSIIEKSKITKRASFYMTMKNTPIMSQSVGQDNLGNIISALVDVYLLSLRPDYKGALICIDEIDVSLHPDSQIKLLQLMCSLADKLSIQFVVTSHSLTLIKEFSKKAKRDSDNYKIVYLKNPSQPYVSGHFDYYSIKADLFNALNYQEPHTKIYFEDEEGKWLFEKLLESLKYQINYFESNPESIKVHDHLNKALMNLKNLTGIRDKIQMIPCCLGCEDLIRLSNADNYFNRVVIILDGDARIKNGENVKKPNIKDYLNTRVNDKDFNNRLHAQNVCFLPDYFAPEVFIYKILYQLVNQQDKHMMFWRSLDQNDSTMMYTRDKIEKELSSISNDCETQEIKKLFQKSLKEFTERCHLLNYYFNSLEKLPYLVSFWEKFIKAYEKPHTLTVQNRYL